MWVAPELRGTGIAAQLVEQVAAWARAELAEPPQLPYEPRPGNRFYERALEDAQARATPQA